jgi:copper homeostasis protein
MRVPVEICVEGLDSALEAMKGGPDRIELCENLAVGGVTPSAGAISIATRANIPVHVLIRPRGGDFCYHGLEREAMMRDVESARSLGASGVVLGLLDADGRIDRETTARFIEAARPMSVTFHKAFDSTRDPFEALDDLISLGVDRVLTSGHASTAIEGLGMLVELTRRASGRIAVMAGGSIRLDQIQAIVAAGVKEIHLGSAACLGGVTDAGLVRRIVEAASMGEIYHIASRIDWERALAEGSYRPESLASEGFIHASTLGQVAGSANRFFRGRSGLVVLGIDLDRVEAAIDWAASPHSSEPFPHIQGPLNVDAVVEVIPLEPGPSGEFVWLPPRFRRD